MHAKSSENIMSIKTIAIVEELKSLTLLETAELVKNIEDIFGVEASPLPIIRKSIQLVDVEPIDEIKTEFDVILEEIAADKKIAILKVVRAITGLGLKEAKDFVDSVPKTLKYGIPLAEAEDIKQQLETEGAKVSFN
jgi:large subunit ribosomal protein L7/L12